LVSRRFSPRRAAPRPCTPAVHADVRGGQRLAAIGVVTPVDLLVLHRTPESFDEHVVERLGCAASRPSSRMSR